LLKERTQELFLSGEQTLSPDQWRTEVWLPIMYNIVQFQVYYSYYSTALLFCGHFAVEKSPAVSACLMRMKWQQLVSLQVMHRSHTRRKPRGLQKRWTRTEELSGESWNKPEPVKQDTWWGKCAKERVRSGSACWKNLTLVKRVEVASLMRSSHTATVQKHEKQFLSVPRIRSLQFTVCFSDGSSTLRIRQRCALATHWWLAPLSVDSTTVLLCERPDTTQLWLFGIQVVSAIQYHQLRTCFPGIAVTTWHSVLRKRLTIKPRCCRKWLKELQPCPLGTCSTSVALSQWDA
jgi:hypothetical protein